MKETCTECGLEMDIMGHNYGTEEYPCCLSCFSLAQESTGANLDFNE